MEGCEQCGFGSNSLTHEGDTLSIAKPCEYLKAYSELCFVMPGMKECTRYEQMCSVSPKLPLCTLSPEKEAHLPPSMKMVSYYYLINELYRANTRINIVFSCRIRRLYFIPFLGSSVALPIHYISDCSYMPWFRVRGSFRLSKET
jgi:hypothetical protein